MEEPDNKPDVDSLPMKPSTLAFRKFINGFFGIIAIIFWMLVVGFLYFYISLPNQVNDFFGNLFWSMKPYETVYFIQLPRPEGFHFCDVGNDHMDDKMEIQVAWTKDKIMLGKSLLMLRPEKIIQPQGEIIDVKCFFKRNYDYRIFNVQMDGTPGKKQPECGFFVFCTYKTDNNKKLALYQIPYSCFEDYRFYLRAHNSVDEKTRKKFEGYQEKVPNELKGEFDKLINAFTSDKSNPYLNVSKKFEMDFSSMDFTGFCAEYKSECYFICKNNVKSSLGLYDCSGQLMNSIRISEKATIKTLSTYEDTDVYVADGNIISLYNILNGKLKLTCKGKLEYSNNDFPISMQTVTTDSYYSDKSYCILSQKNNLYMLEKIMNYDDVSYLPKSLEITKLIQNINIENISKNAITSGGKTTIYYYWYTDSNNIKDSDISLFSKTVDGNLMTQYYCGYGIEDIRNFDIQAMINKYIMITKSKKSINVLFNSRSVIKLLETSRINEPVDEAYVTYEYGKLTIYFMNKNSIYRWQNSQPGIDNLKLRELDLKPEPIKTKNSQ